MTFPDFARAQWRAVPLPSRMTCVSLTLGACACAVFWSFIPGPWALAISVGWLGGVSAGYVWGGRTAVSSSGVDLHRYRTKAGRDLMARGIVLVWSASANDEDLLSFVDELIDGRDIRFRTELL